LAPFGTAPVLPNDGVANALTCCAVPNQCGFSLIGDADCGGTAGATDICNDGGYGFTHRRPYLFGIVFNPTVPRVDLIERPLMCCDGNTCQRECDGPRRCRSLIYGDQIWTFAYFCHCGLITAAGQRTSMMPQIFLPVPGLWVC